MPWRTSTIRIGTSGSAGNRQVAQATIAPPDMQNVRSPASIDLAVLSHFGSTPTLYDLCYLLSGGGNFCLSAGGALYMTGGPGCDLYRLKHGAIHVFGGPNATIQRGNRLSLVKADWPILVCVLGNFTLLQCGHPVVIPGAAKRKACWRCWPSAMISVCPAIPSLPSSGPIRAALAGQSLNSLVYSLRKQLGGAIGGASPVLYTDGYYRLNLAAGVGTDLAQFEVLVQQGARQRRSGDEGAAMQSYSSAVALYRGDLGPARMSMLSLNMNGCGPAISPCWPCWPIIIIRAGCGPAVSTMPGACWRATPAGRTPIA